MQMPLQALQADDPFLIELSDRDRRPEVVVCLYLSLLNATLNWTATAHMSGHG